MISQSAQAEPGVFADLPFDEYLSLDAASSSLIRSAIADDGSISMALMKAYMDAQPLDQVPPIRLGSLTHCGKLEPEKLIERYVVMPDFGNDPENVDGKGQKSTSANTKWAQTKKAEFITANKGRQHVTQSEYDAYRAISRSIAGCPLTSEILNDSGPVELSIVWIDPDTGVRCKARIDKVCKTLNRLADLKTTGRPLERFHKELLNRSYHIQLAFYADGWREVTGTDFEPWIIPVESSPPYRVGPAPIGQVSIESARTTYKAILNLYAETLKSGEWNDYEAPSEWNVPTWGLNGVDDEAPDEPADRCGSVFAEALADV